MWKAEIKVGTEYAMREKRGRGIPFQRVRILEHIRRDKWKAEWVDPHPGLVDYVESSQLIVAWKDHKAFLREETDKERLEAHNESQGYRRDSPVDLALHHVFESVGDEVRYNHGIVWGATEAVDRVATRARLAIGKHSPVAFVDRHGNLTLPFDEVVELARNFCMAEPATVLTGVESTEREWSQQAQRGEDYIVGLLNEYRASWALIRQWASHDAAIAQRESEIQRLERLVWDAVYALQKAGQDGEASRLRRAVERRS